MGYGGKVEEQRRAVELRRAGWTYTEICQELGVSKASVSLWVRDVEVDPALLAGRRRDRYLAGNLTKRPHPMHTEKLDEIARCREAAATWLGELSERDLFIAGIALYAGEGSKTDGRVKFTNADPRMVSLFLRWLRRFFDVDERRLRVHLYLHEGLDLEAAVVFWSGVTHIPRAQFGAPYRAVADGSIRRTKHVQGCPSVSYSCSRTHRMISGLTASLLS
jgi:transcriptional regulator with XRE-family HTH domain